MSIFEKNKGLIVGAAGGALVGAGMSAVSVITGCVQIALYPVHMTIRITQAAIEPALHLASPLFLMPLYTGLGLLGGLAAQAGMEDGNNDQLQADVKELSEKMEGQIEDDYYRDRKLDEILQEQIGLGFDF